MRPCEAGGVSQLFKRNTLPPPKFINKKLKMDTKGQTCRLLANMIKDEEEGVEVYETLKSEMTSKQDKKVIAEILKDEKKHSKKVRSLYKRLKC